MLILAHPPSEYVPPRAPTGLDHPGDTEPQPTDLPGAERSVAGGAAAWAPPRVVSPTHPYSRGVARGAGAPPPRRSTLLFMDLAVHGGRCRQADLPSEYPRHPPRLQLCDREERARANA